MPSLFHPQIGIELVYSFVIILCSLMVYYATKEMYELSSYKGIKYFRQAFLFFAIAYFFRSFIQFFLISLNLNYILDLSPMFIGWMSLFVFLYFSSMSIFSLLYSIMCKKWSSDKKRIILFHILAISIALFGSSFRGMLISLILNLVLLLCVFSVLLVAYKEMKLKKKGQNLFVIYLLLSLFWVLNIFDILIPRFLEGYQIFIYLISISLFMTILYKVLKKSGN